MAKRASNKTESGFSKITKAYKADPSIENYVKLRRKNPKEQIEVAMIGGMEPLFYMEDELRRNEFSPELVAGAMDADSASISEFSLQVMEKMIEARKLSKAGETQLIRRRRAIPEKLIDWIITCSLDALSWNDTLHIPRDLIVLIRERLGGSNPTYQQASHAHEQKKNAALIAAQLKLRGISPTYKLVGSSLGVVPSTVKRWFEPGEYERETDRWLSIIERDDLFKPNIKRRKKPPLRSKDTAQR